MTEREKDAILNCAKHFGNVAKDAPMPLIHAYVRGKMIEDGFSPGEIKTALWFLLNGEWDYD